MIEPACFLKTGLWAAHRMWRRSLANKQWVKKGETELEVPTVVAETVLLPQGSSCVDHCDLGTGPWCCTVQLYQSISSET